VRSGVPSEQAAAVVCFSPGDRDSAAASGDMADSDVPVAYRDGNDTGRRSFALGLLRST